MQVLQSPPVSTQSSSPAPSPTELSAVSASEAAPSRSTQAAGVRHRGKTGSAKSEAAVEWSVSPPDSLFATTFRAKPSVLRVWAKEPPRPRLGCKLQYVPDTLQLSRWLSHLPNGLQQQFHTSVRMPSLGDGMMGTPQGYSLRTDDFVASALLLSFFLMLWVASASWRFLYGQVREFFRIRFRGNLFANPNNAVLRGRFWVLVQCSFLLSLLYFNYVQECEPELFSSLEVHSFLFATGLVFLCFYAVKLLLYGLVNSIFFSASQRRLCSEVFFTSILAQSAGLLPISLLVVFFNINYTQAFWSFVLLLGFVKLLLFYKYYRIFFASLLGKVHIFLYFCTLELTPLFLLWVVLALSTRWLSTLGWLS